MIRVLTLLLVAVAAAVPAIAQEYPVSGEVYLSFEPNRNVHFRNVAPGETFQLWIITEIPVDPSTPHGGIVGVEGGVSLPPELELVEVAFEEPAINLGITFREPGLESFIVGLGDCVQLGRRNALGVLTLRLAVYGQDLEIGVEAPSVGAAAVSSFSGMGPGWALRDCMDGGPIDLVLFGPNEIAPSTVVINSTSIPVEGAGVSRVKARFGRD